MIGTGLVVAPLRGRRGTPAPPFRHRVPPTRVPGRALEQTHDAEHGTDHQPTRAQRLHGVLAARGGESARRQPQRRDVRAIELDDRDRSTGGERHHGPETTRRSCHRSDGPRSELGTAVVSSTAPSRRNADRNWRSRSGDDAVAAPTNARTTTSVSGSRLATIEAQTCRSRRATRCRVTAGPTALLTTNPTRATRGPPGSGRTSTRRVDTCTTMSRRPTRRPPRVVARKSDERCRRCCSGNTRASDHRARRMPVRPPRRIRP